MSARIGCWGSYRGYDVTTVSGWGYCGCNDGDLVHFWKVVTKDTSPDLLFLLAVWISLGGYAGMGKWEAIAAWHGVYQQYLAWVNKDTVDQKIKSVVF